MNAEVVAAAAQYYINSTALRRYVVRHMSMYSAADRHTPQSDLVKLVRPFIDFTPETLEDNELKMLITQALEGCGSLCVHSADYTSVKGAAGFLDVPVTLVSDTVPAADELDASGADVMAFQLRFTSSILTWAPEQWAELHTAMATIIEAGRQLTVELPVQPNVQKTCRLALLALAAGATRVAVPAVEDTHLMLTTTVGLARTLNLFNELTGVRAGLKMTPTPATLLAVFTLVRTTLDWEPTPDTLRVGLAAGFDFDAIIPPALPDVVQYLFSSWRMDNPDDQVTDYPPLTPDEA